MTRACQLGVVFHGGLLFVATAVHVASRTARAAGARAGTAAVTLPRAATGLE